MAAANADATAFSNCSGAAVETMRGRLTSSLTAVAAMGLPSRAYAYIFTGLIASFMGPSVKGISPIVQRLSR